MAARTVVSATAGPDGPEATITVEDDAPARIGCCPFYGLVGNARLGVACGSGGNGCALEMGHVPCAMEMAGDRSDWDACTACNVTGRREAVDAVVTRFHAIPFGRGADEGMDGRFARMMGRPWAPTDRTALASARHLPHHDA